MSSLFLASRGTCSKHGKFWMTEPGTFFLNAYIFLVLNTKSPYFFPMACRYGTTGRPVQRDVIRLKDGLSLDLAPPYVTICKVVPSNSAQVPSQPKYIQTSSAWTIKHLKEQMASVLGCDAQATSRIWLIDEASKPQIATGLSITPEGLKHAWLEPAGDDEVLRYSSINHDVTLALELANEDGSWLVNNTASDTTEPAHPKKHTLFGGKSFLDTIVAKTQHKRAPLTTTNMNSQDHEPVASTSNLGAPPMRMTRSQTGSSGSKKGLVGLTNLGNTCFVSASSTYILQNACLDSVYR